MTDEEILNGNELIAKFMGYQILNKKYETQYMCSSNESAWGVTEGEIVCDSRGREVDDENQEPYLYLEHLPFNSSWDWLMPVVVKIGKMYEDLYKHAFTTKTPISYDIETTYSDVICRHVTIEIHHLFERIVEFIKWFNNQK